MEFNVGDEVYIKLGINTQNYKQSTPKNIHDPGWNSTMTALANKKVAYKITNVNYFSKNAPFYIIDGWSFISAWLEPVTISEDDKVNREHPKWNVIKKIRALRNKQYAHMEN